MSRPRTQLRFVPRDQQRGIATILIVLLVGMALTATALGVVHTIRSTQQRQLSVHSLTAAQVNAWRGAEIVRSYLGSEGVTPAVLQSWATRVPVPLMIASVPGFAGANIIAVGTPTSGTYPVTVLLSGSAGSGGAAARSLMEVVYDVTPGASASGDGMRLEGNTIYRDLVLSASAKVNDGVIFNVDGDVSVQNDVTITGTTAQINATGTVTLAGDRPAKLGLIHANEDVSIGGSVCSYAAIIETLGNVTLELSGYAGTITAGKKATFNGYGCIGNTANTVNAVDTVVVSNSTNIGAIKTQANVDWANDNGSIRGADSIHADLGVTYTGGKNESSGLRAEIIAGGDVTLTNGGQARSITTLGNTRITQSNDNIDSLYGKGTLSVTNNDKHIASLNSWGTVGGDITVVNSPYVYVNKQPNYTPFMTPVAFTPPTEVKIAVKPLVDVYALKGEANYAFTVDTNGYIKVRVQKVNGIADGDYFFGKYGETSQDYLCTAISTAAPVDGSGTCTAPVLSNAAPFCSRSVSSDSEHCLRYDAEAYTPEFVLNSNEASQRIPTGFYWFGGDLKIRGHETNPYYATFMATGDIRTDNNATFYAPNYTSATYQPYQGVCTNVVNSMYPTQLCNASTSTYLATGLGNAVFLAGGCSGTGGCSNSNNTFSGGGIYFLNSGTILVYGSVIGDNLMTQNTVTIDGLIAVTGQNSVNMQTNISSNSVIKNPVPMGNYDPGQLPCTVNCAAATTQSAVVRWTRYR